MSGAKRRKIMYAAPSMIESKTWSNMTDEEVLDEDLKIFKAIKQYSLSSLGLWGVIAIIERLNLKSFFDHYVQFNSSNDLPYHNLYHGFNVFLNCYEGSYFTKLQKEEVRGMCAGALFHDFNHTGGECSDDKNIENALEGLMLAQKFASYNLSGLSDNELKIAVETIKITQYPYTSEPSSFHEMIIRDSDLMQPYEEDDEMLFHQYVGLMKELKLTDTVSFNNNVISFLDNISWNTPWANKKAEVKEWNKHKSHLKQILETKNVTDH